MEETPVNISLQGSFRSYLAADRVTVTWTTVELNCKIKCLQAKRELQARDGVKSDVIVGF